MTSNASIGLPDGYTHYLMLDLEATCCNQGSVPPREMEIIEIGAVMLDARSLEMVSEYTGFVRPVRHTQLTPFCKELTSITQEQVDQAPMFPGAASLFNRWLCQYPCFLFCSWGDYDRNQIKQDCQYNNVANPIGAQHLNLKTWFSQQHGLKKKLGLAQAVSYCGLEFEGRHHRGIDDARNMARLVRAFRAG